MYNEKADKGFSWRKLLGWNLFFLMPLVPIGFITAIACSEPSVKVTPLCWIWGVVGAFLSLTCFVVGFGFLCDMVKPARERSFYLISGGGCFLAFYIAGFFWARNTSLFLLKSSQLTVFHNVSSLAPTLHMQDHVGFIFAPGVVKVDESRGDFRCWNAPSYDEELDSFSTEFYIRYCHYVAPLYDDVVVFKSNLSHYAPVWVIQENANALGEWTEILTSVNTDDFDANDCKDSLDYVRPRVNSTEPQTVFKYRQQDPYAKINALRSRVAYLGYCLLGIYAAFSAYHTFEGMVVMDPDHKTEVVLGLLTFTIYPFAPLAVFLWESAVHFLKTLKDWIRPPPRPEEGFALPQII